MTIIYVQFTDASEQEVGGWFGIPQDPGAYPNCAEIDTGDDRWKRYYEAIPLDQRQSIPAPSQA